MPLGMEVGLGPRLCVRWEPSTSHQKGRSPLIFGPRLLWPNDGIDQDATWYGGRRGGPLGEGSWDPISHNVA